MTEFLELDKSHCKNCYKCIRHCPVKAIKFSGNQAHIVSDECILCGECYVVCPQDAKKIKDETEIVKVLLAGSDPVVASVAPSFAAYYDGIGIQALRRALIALGFASAEETALGATMVKREYERLAQKGDMDVIITTSCPSINTLVQKYYPNLVGFLAPVVTPMAAHCADIKRRMPNAKTVFIGPCLSKKSEADRDGIDAALTFDELTGMLEKANIRIEAQADSDENSRARLFPTDGGILGTLSSRNPRYTYMSVSGTENCMDVLKDLQAGGLHNCFVEMSSCAGSCISGPIMRKNHDSPLRHYQAIRNYAGANDFGIGQPASELLATGYDSQPLEEPLPTEEQIAEIFRKMGKHSKDDELNCGTCGYNTCREKAIAVFRGKAEISMCLPSLIEKSERFSSNILDNSPNGIMVVNEALEVQQINVAAMHMLHIKSRSDVMGEPVMRIMDPAPFVGTLQMGKVVRARRDYYAEFDEYIELTIILDKSAGHLIAFFRDVTEEEKEKKAKEQLSRQTAETADKVVDKQMRIVQEIASLLGETAAETKIVLTKLKESVNDGK